MLAPDSLPKFLAAHGARPALAGTYQLQWNELSALCRSQQISGGWELLPAVGNVAEILRSLIRAWAQGRTVALYDNSTFRSLDFIKQILPESAQLGFMRPTDPALIIFTSGSSGKPKAVALSGANLYYSALGSWEFFQWAPTDVAALSLPLYHIGGIMIFLRALLAGYALYWQAEHYLQWCGKTPDKINLYSLVPTQLAQLLMGHPDNLARAKSIIVSGGPSGPALQAQIVHWQLPVYLSYGATESAAQMTVSGRILPYRQLKIAPSGHICLRGPCRFLYYYQDRQLVRPFDGEGWWESSDLGHWGPDGTLQVEGRSDLIYISGGKKISPLEIEAALQPLTQALVVPVAAEKWGQVGFCFYSGPASPQKLQDFLARTLPSWKIPHYFYHDPEIAQAQGKISRQQKILQAQAIIGKQRDSDESDDISSPTAKEPR